MSTTKNMQDNSGSLERNPNSSLVAGDLQVEAEGWFWSLQDDVWKMNRDVGMYRCLSTTKGR
jgi:hypothetical protein